jgi:CRP/FNR family transcriptional regulator, anaerobic regulatory protein
MEKLANYFGQMGFEGDNLKRIVDSFSLQAFEKNDFVVEYGKPSTLVLLIAACFNIMC